MATVSRQQWFSYWRLAWKHKPSSKWFSIVRTIPAVIIAVATFLIRRAKHAPVLVTDMWLVIGITVVVYLALYAVETVWNFASISPPLMDANSVGVLARQQERQLESIRGRLTNFTEDEKAVLKFILDNGAVNHAQIMAGGFQSAIVFEARRKGNAHALIAETCTEVHTPFDRYFGPSTLSVYQINPAIESALRRLLD